MGLSSAVRLVEAADRQFFADVGDQEGLLRLLRHLAAWDPPAS